MISGQHKQRCDATVIKYRIIQKNMEIPQGICIDSQNNHRACSKKIFGEGPLAVVSCQNQTFIQAIYHPLGVLGRGLRESILKSALTLMNGYLHNFCSLDLF